MKRNVEVLQFLITPCLRRPNELSYISSGVCWQEIDREGARVRSAITIDLRVVGVVPVTGTACALAVAAVVAIVVELEGVVEGGHKSVGQAGNIVVAEGKSTLRS